MFSRIFILLSLLLAPLATVQAKGGMVTAANKRAAQAGQEMLRAGGSATDAAMAMMLTLGVVEPQSSGIGGGGFLVHHDGKTSMIATIDGRETAPAAARPDRFLGADGKPLAFSDAYPGGLSVGVPGNIALMARAHARWGKLPWARLFQPAIRIAEKGYMVTPILASRLAMMQTVWADFPEARALYWQDGAPKKVGDTVRNPELAKTLRRIAVGGPDEFYKGRTAHAISDAVAAAPRHPAALTLDDLAAYHVQERPAVCTRYRVWKICSMGPPSSGATTVLGILGILEHFDLKRLGKSSPVAWHLIGEAMQLAYADRGLYLGDADFVPVPVAGLLDPAYLASRAKLVSPDRTLADYLPGNPPGAAPRAALPAPPEHGTTHFVAVDRSGNVDTMTSTVEGPFGSQLLADGMILNNELTDFSFAPQRGGAPAANRIEPGKRPLSSMAPTIVYDAQDKVVLALGSAGGKQIIMHVTRTLIGVLDWGLDIGDAVALPNIFFRDRTLLVEEGSALHDMIPALTALGHSVAPATLGSKVNAIQRTPTGWRGAADPRSEGVTLGE